MLLEIEDQTNIASSNLSSLDRDALFGDGFFTTGIIQKNQFSQLGRHLERLKKSAEQLLFADFDLDSLAETLKQLVNKTAKAVIRITVFRRQRQRGYAISAEAETVCRIALFDCPSLPIDRCELINSSISISSNPSLAGIKHLNRLDSVLAASQLSASNQEALMFYGKQVICGSKSNLFVKLDGVWLTPKIDQCGIAGITRARVIETLVLNNIEITEAPIERSDLGNIEAAFVTNSLIGIWPAKSINGRSLDINTSQELQMLVLR